MHIHSCNSLLVQFLSNCCAYALLYSDSQRLRALSHSMTNNINIQILREDIYKFAFTS